jgi:hypothetical protein
MACERDCYRMLSDFRQLRLILSVMDLFSIPAMQAALSKEMKIPFYHFRRAVLVPAQDFENISSLRMWRSTARTWSRCL